MNTEHLLGDFRLSINIYSPNMLGCQEAKQNFFTVHLLYQLPGLTPELTYLTPNADACVGNGQWKIGW